MDLQCSVMSKKFKGSAGVNQAWHYRLWRQPSKWWRAQWLQLRGWKCEGPFPKPHHDALLVLGPGMDLGNSTTSLAEYRLKLLGTWFHESLLKAPPQSGHHLVLIDHRSKQLPDALMQAGSLGISVQIIRVAFSEKRIRCNTPFTPGKYPERDLAYIRRMFTYNS